MSANPAIGVAPEYDSASARTTRLIGASAALEYVLLRVGQVAPIDATVLLLGETGTGKGSWQPRFTSEARAAITGSSR